MSILFEEPILLNNPRLPYLKDKANKLPLQPGIYIFKNKSDTIIYIGKAKFLKNRVSSYFRSIEKHKPKVYKMVQEAYDFEYIVASSEFDAIMLEWNMIKEHTPKYNILIKNDKGYSYIKISPKKMDDPYKPWSKITAERQKHNDSDALFIGPFASSFLVKTTVEEANTIFALPTCSKTISFDRSSSRPCLNFYIKKCNGACCGKISFEHYKDSVAHAVDFIKNGGEETVKHLTEMMETAAENLEFEKAASLRDNIATIKRNSLKQDVVFTGIYSSDAVAIAEDINNICISVLKIRKERIVDKDEFVFENIGTQKEAMSAFLTQYYSSSDSVPDVIMLYDDIDDLKILQTVINEHSNHSPKVKLIVPVKGENRKITDMAFNNAVHRLSHDFGHTPKNIASLDELAKLLGITAPKRIEAYDISNIGSSVITGSMAVYQDASPLKNHYRKFLIKDISQTDDYASMKEMLTRRFAERIRENQTDPSFSATPDLILIDGGKGHLTAAKEVMQTFGLESIPIFGMVKDSRHRTRAISSSGGEISLRETYRAFTLVTEIQNEAHRFAVGYSTKAHIKKSLGLNITNAPGIGKRRAAELMKKYKTVSAICSASEEDLALTSGMTKASAKSLKNFLDEYYKKDR